MSGLRRLAVQAAKREHLGEVEKRLPASAARAAPLRGLCTLSFRRLAPSGKTTTASPARARWAAVATAPSSPVPRRAGKPPRLRTSGPRSGRSKSCGLPMLRSTRG